MIKIKPNIEIVVSCPFCGEKVQPMEILWQGIHVCGVATCWKCTTDFLEDLPIGHAMLSQFAIDYTHKKVVKIPNNSWHTIDGWFGVPFAKAILEPQYNIQVKVQVEKIKKYNNVIVLNCIDFLYGHSLLKLLNIEYYLKNYSNLGMIVIIPKLLRWMVPEGVAEVWVVDLPLMKSQAFYPNFDDFIKRESNRFNTIYLSKAYPHPKAFDISNFSGVRRHDFNKQRYRITYIWRSDRIWWNCNGCNDKHLVVEQKRNALQEQNFKIQELFQMLKIYYPNAIYTVAGLGCETQFPSWIDDCRVEKFTVELEKQSCQLYSDSRLVIGIHGSNMILPSAHAGITIDLIPMDRWGNLAQDIAYQEDDIRMISHRYSHLPIELDIRTLAKIAAEKIRCYNQHKELYRYIPIV